MNPLARIFSVLILSASPMMLFAEAAESGQGAEPPAEQADSSKLAPSVSKSAAPAKSKAKKQPTVVMEASDASYVLSRGVLTLGEARFRLTRNAENSACWRYEYVAKPSGIARLFIGKVTEKSDFCLSDGQVISQFFEFSRPDKDEESFSLRFNWMDGVVRSSGGEMRPLKSGMIDRLAMQIAVQNWVVSRQGKVGPETITLTKVEDDRIKPYSFRIVAEERIETPAGTFDTIRVERVNDPKKQTLFWLAPSRGYLAVRVEQIKKGNEQLKMLLIQ